MNKFFLTCSILFIVLLGFSAKAQLFKNVKLGLKAGANFSELKSKDFTSALSSDWHLGGYLQLQGKKWGLGAEIIYDRSIYSLQDFATSQFFGIVRDTNNHSTTITASKYQVPLYISYKMSIIHLQVGMVFEGFLSFTDSKAFFNSTKTLFEQNSKSAFVGLWLDITKRLNIGGRYIFGIDKISNELITNPWTTREIQVHVGLRLL